MSTPPSEERNPRTGPHTGAQAVIADASDPARRPDVFVLVSGTVIALLSLIPGGA